MARAKIVATLGPASSSKEVLIELIKAGVNVFRLNMSHGKHEVVAELVKRIRLISREIKQEVGLLLDLQGPKIRVGELKTNIILKEGETWFLGYEEIENKPNKNFLPSVYENIVSDCIENTDILFDDGKIRAKTIKKHGEDLFEIKIIVGGELSSHKGINIPDCSLSAPALTEKDKKDLLFGLGLDVDFVALSFVRQKSDVVEIKSILHALKKNIPVISKIEKPQALDNLDEILEATDMIMVARGDMGVEIGNHRVPVIQKEIISKCNTAGIPVITATQMLESMTFCPTPTRAEASDVANAIWDGSDAVMLSGEVAVGKYPVETIHMMKQIIEEAESHPKARPYLRNQNLSTVNAAVAAAASVIAENINAKKIISMTESGNSCFKLSKFRPKTEVLGITPNLKAVRKITLLWGVSPFMITDYDEDNFDFYRDVILKVQKHFALTNGDKLVITRGDGRFFIRGTSNSVKVEIIQDQPKVKGSSDVILEAEDQTKRILLDQSVCANCHNCIQICPHDIWISSDKNNKDTILNQDQIKYCSMDMECIKVCPTGAIEIIPKN